MLKNKGFTLLEIIISITIFALIITVVSSVFVYIQKNYKTAANFAELIQNGRVVLERMSREIRQAKRFVTTLPEERMNAPHEIKFHDGHLSVVKETDQSQGGSGNTIILSVASRSENNYYKDLFIKIIDGTGRGQIRKIISYDGISKTAMVDRNWEIIPSVTSFYKIDSSFYYIHYYKDENNNILRKVTTYCFSTDSLDCVSPETYVSYDATPPRGQSLLEITLEPPKIIGEHINNLEFWGTNIVNIFMGLNIENQNIELKTKVFGRNL